MWIKDEQTGIFSDWYYVCVDTGEKYNPRWPIRNEWNKKMTKQILIATDDEGKEHKIELKKIADWG